MSRIVELSNGRQVAMSDDEAEAWELANKIISDLRGKYNLNEPHGVDDLRMWMDRIADDKAYHAMYPPITAAKTAKAMMKAPPTTSRLEVPYIGTGSSFSDTEAMAYIPAGATLHGVYNDVRKLKFIITYSVP